MIDRIVSSGLFNSMVRYVLDDSMSNFLIARMYLLFSRIAMKEYFLKILDVTSVDLKLFFERWLEYYNHNGNPRNKKSICWGYFQFCLILFHKNRSVVGVVS